MPHSWTHVVAVGASAGGLKAISTLIGALPADFAAPVVVAIHARETLSLAEILGRRARLPTEVVQNSTILKSGRIYVCPGGMQTYFTSERVMTTKEGLGERFTPSINILFESLSRALGSRAIGVVMSGMLNDGTDGVRKLAHEGARVFVQSPDEAEHASMPNHVIWDDEPMVVLPALEIAAELVEIVGTDRRAWS